MTPHFTLNAKMKDFNSSYIQDPIIETHTNGTMFKFSSGYAVYVGNYKTQNSSTTKQGNITLSGVDDISIESLGFTSVLGGSVAKNGYNANTAIFGSWFEKDNIHLNLFRGDTYSGNDSIVSVIVFGLWR